ncbi:hypothetical protein ACTXT7_002171 [Hymenolepis weldensis]
MSNSVAANSVKVDMSILSDIMSYDRLSSSSFPPSADSDATDGVEDSEDLMRRRYNMQLIYDVVKKMCETGCEVAFIFDPKQSHKLVDYPDRDEEGIKRWDEAINFIRNPKAKPLKRSFTYASPEKSMKQINFHVSSPTSPEPEEKNLNTMRFANNANPALYACTMHILRDKLIREPISNEASAIFDVDDTDKEDEFEKENRESPIPTWLERLEYMASKIKVFNEPFTSLMPPHPEEIFKNLGDSEGDSTKTDSSSEDSLEEELSDSQFQSSSLSSLTYSSYEDDDENNQNTLENPRVIDLLNKLGIDPKTGKPKTQDNKKSHTPSASVSDEESEGKIDTPLTAAYNRFGLDICKMKKDRSSPHKALHFRDLSKMKEQFKPETYTTAPLRVYAIGSDSKKSNCAIDPPREPGYQCPCYFENYIDNATNVEQMSKLCSKMQAKIQALTGSGFNPTYPPTEKRERNVVSNIANNRNTGINGKFTTKSSANGKHFKANHRQEKTAEEFIEVPSQFEAVSTLTMYSTIIEQIRNRAPLNWERVNLEKIRNHFEQQITPKLHIKDSNPNINKDKSTPDDQKGTYGVKAMCETACKDPKGVEKFEALPDRDEKEMKKWHEAIDYIRNPKVKAQLRKFTPEEVKETMCFAKMFVSLIVKDAALYACILRILRPKLLEKPISNGVAAHFNKDDDDNFDTESEDEKGSHESPIPTWLERLEYMASKIKVFNEPFTSLMPPHPEEIFKNLGDSEGDSTKTDSSSEDSQEEESSDSQSSFHFFSDKDEDDKDIQDLLGNRRVNPKTKKFKFQETNTKDSIRPPPSRMMKNDPSISNPVASAIDKKESKQENRCNARGPGYQCPCYFENYIDNTMNVEYLQKLLKMAQERIRVLRSREYGRNGDETCY